MKKLIFILCAIILLFTACDNGKETPTASPTPTHSPSAEPVPTPIPIPTPTYKLPDGMQYIGIASDKTNGLGLIYNLYGTYFGIEFGNLAYTFSYPSTDLSVEDCYNGLIRGEYDLIISRRVDEYIEAAEEQEEPFEVMPIGMDAVVFKAIGKMKTENGEMISIDIEGGMTSAEVRQLFFSVGFWPNWDGTYYSTYPLEGTGNTLAWLGEKAWSKDVFLWRGIYDNPTWFMIVNRIPGVLLTPTSFSGDYNPSIGYGKIISIDGVYPTDETILDGTYPYGVTYYAIIRASEEEDSTARKIAELLSSPEGSQYLERRIIEGVYERYLIPFFN